jgi:hypothetical protein
MAKAKQGQALSDKLNHIQVTLNAPKNLYNSFGKYKYRNLEGIFEGLKPLLKETGCAVTVSDEIVCVNEMNYIKATATLSNGSDDSISVTGWAREAVSKKGMDDSQITGATSSYARKYAMNGLFAIDDVADADGMDNRKETLINGKEPTKGNITVDQNLKLDRLSRNTAMGKDMQGKIRKFIDKNPTEKEAQEKIDTLEKAIREIRNGK